MTQLRASMQQKLKQEKIEEDALKFRNTNVALPVNENEYNNIDPNVSENESSDESIEIDTISNIQTESNWKSLILRWINMLEDESNEENDNNNESDSDSDIDNREFEISVANILNLPYPARDQNAKWRLQDIFIESLGEPNYLSTFMLGNS